MRNLAAPEVTADLGRKLTRVGVHPDGLTLTPEGIAMQSILDLGADVDSRYIWVACAAASFAPYRIDNERGAIVAWLRSLPRGARLGVESTGTYHELVAELAHKAGLQVFVINARDLRRYGQGVGRRGKTDRISAEVIARYVAREHGELHAYVPPSKQQRALKSLLSRRATVVVSKGALAQSLRGVAGIGGELRQLMTAFDRLLARIDALNENALRKSAAARAARHIDSVPGFGTLASTYLAYNFTRYPFSSSDSAVAFSGLDPRPDDSGQRRGRRRLSKRGPSEERRILFNCARSAARTTLWRPHYQAQLAKGLTATEATVILARKMLRVAFALYKQDRAFDPARLGGHA
jgi:transposase